MFLGDLLTISQNLFRWWLGAEQATSHYLIHWWPSSPMYTCVNELTHWPLGNLNEIFRHVIFKQILVIDGSVISCEIALIWMSLDFTDDQSTLVQVMAWCHQAPSHCLSQCWPTSLSPYGITRPQWVNDFQSISPESDNLIHKDPIQSHEIWTCQSRLRCYNKAISRLVSSQW